MLHHIPEKALLKTSGCASCSALYMHREEAIISTRIMKIAEMIWFLFSYKTDVIT
jgi:hypothetical protein